jgi:hypothetical protein
MAKENLKDLNASARLEKLKKLKREREKEIAEAQEAIKETEQELNQEKEWIEKVPIPQVAMDSLQNLSAEEKQILKTHRGLKEEIKEKDSGDKKEDISSKTKQQTNSELEDSIQNEEVTQEMMQAANMLGQGSNLDYINQLSQEPVANLYNEAKSLYETAKDKGYLSAEENRRMAYISSAMEQKLTDVDAGDYSLTQEMAKAASVTQQIAESAGTMYKSEQGKGENVNDAYRQ